MSHTWLIALLLLIFSTLSCQSTSKKATESAKNWSNKLYKNHRQLSYSGQRSGESYFSPDSEWMVFQSEREEGNPFYQIYLMNLKTGKTNRISPGYGKTTCAWIHPNKNLVMYSSTHLDKDARKKQKDELDFRNSGKQRRYSWDYDPNYEIFSASKTGKNTKRLTNAFGYDAEGSYSPDGQWIAFSSNRHAYSEKLSEEDQKRFDMDPSFMLDIYIMKADGSQVKRLTTHKGYDGGPFFSPDGQRIIWRRFTADGHMAEIYTMNVDGSDVKKLTNLKAMSWAPYYHPSGDYVIFTTNKHGYHNFELYLVDTEGRKEPIRVTDLEGFDGLPVFLPNGHQLAWSRKMKNGQSQIFISDWNDRLARQALDLPAATPKKPMTAPEIRLGDARSWVEYLADKQFQGRMTGSDYEKTYSQAIADYFKSLGLKPAVGKSYLHEFEFLADVQLGRTNVIKIEGISEILELGKNWTPLSSSKSGSFQSDNLVFAGYGIVAPASDNMKAYDSYADLDVDGKWVVLLRFLPEEVENKRRLYLNRYARLEHKVMMARNRGAKGVIFVSGPSSGVKKQLIDPKSMSGVSSSLPILSINDKVAMQLMSDSDKNFKDWLKQADKEKITSGFAIKSRKILGHLELKPIYKKGLNVLAKLNRSSKNNLILGAHGDHLGKGHSASSMRNNLDKDDIHYGADDNASGVAAVIELAEYYAANPAKLKSNMVFAIWSGEELGNLGSAAFIKDHLKSEKTIAYLNFDMIGRFDKKLSVQGLGSSKEWQGLIEPLMVTSRTPMTLQNDPYLPTDAISFYNAKVPILSFFTGVHGDYHSPRDTPDKVNYEGIINTAKIAKSLIDDLGTRTKPLKYESVKATGKENKGRRFRIFLGTMPDYTNKKVKGVKLSGVIKGGPAEKAGLKGGDIIVEFASMKIENIYDYVYTLETLKPGKKTQITVLRGGQKKVLDIVPASKN